MACMKLLLVEDNEDIVQNIVEYFELKGHVLDVARDGLSGLHLATSAAFDAIILDLMLPGISGLEICERLRQSRSNVPIVILTAKDTLDNKLSGFRVGADDYLVKPFALSELEVRVEALIRRSKQLDSSRVLLVGDLQFDLDTLEVTRQGKLLDLNPIPRNILRLLMQESPKVVTRSRLEREIWGEDPPDSDTLRSHMYSLRAAIDRPFNTALLHTVPREGYRLVVRERET
jgi:DNA-binding response OmpR family regulator